MALGSLFRLRGGFEGRNSEFYWYDWDVSRFVSFRWVRRETYNHTHFHIHRLTAPYLLTSIPLSETKQRNKRVSDTGLGCFGPFRLAIQRNRPWRRALSLDVHAPERDDCWTPTLLGHAMPRHTRP